MGYGNLWSDEDWENEIKGYTTGNGYSPKKSGTYIISDGDGSVKIGVAVDIKKRLRNLQSANPKKLTVLFWEPDDDIEFELHTKFDKLCIRGEWFKHTNDTDNFIYGYTHGDPDLWDPIK